MVDAFALRAHVPKQCRCDLNDRTTRRYLDGRRVRRWCCRCTAVAHALVASGLLPVPSDALDTRDHAGLALFLALGVRANWWDRVVAPRADDHDARALVRFATVDLSLQAALWRLALGLPEPLAGTPAWAEERGVAAHLRLLRDRVTPRPTYDALVKALGFPRSSVIEWFTGKRLPSAEGIDALAGYFGTKIDDASPAEMQLELRRVASLARFARALADVHGRAFVEDLATVFVDLTRCRMSALGPKLAAGELRGEALVHLVVRAPFDVTAAALQHAADAHAAHDGWPADLERAVELWQPRDLRGDVDAAALSERALCDLLMHLPRRRPDETDRRAMESA